MANKKHFRWIGLGTIIAFMMGIMALVAYQAIIWTPIMIEIASVTWNDRPVL